MTTGPRRSLDRVAASCALEQVLEIRVRAGDGLAIGHRNQHPAFSGSAAEEGHCGWLPASCANETAEGS